MTKYIIHIHYFHFSIIALFLTLLSVESSAVSLLICPNNCFCYQICPAQAITIEAEEREDGSRRTTRSVTYLVCLPFSFLAFLNSALICQILQV